jgi:hypothetical protein
VTGDENPDHHGSHRNLLWASDDSRKKHDIDAIIVPTARPPAYLDEAAALADSLSCTLVTLHSKRWTSAAGAARRVPPTVDLIAIDVPSPAHLSLPEWETTRLLAGTVFARQTDISAKRNMGLVLSRMLGWSRVMFLDDDITELNPDDVRCASGLLDTHDAVGLHVGGFPDNSVVCHAYREAGGNQQTFVGGGALTVHLERANSFFPDIYNDDWFFLLGDKRIQSVGVAGKVRQHPYDPFRNPDRARGEELGDVLAEGLYWLLDQDRSILAADEDYWFRFLAKRKSFVDRVLRMVRQDEALGTPDRTRRVEALKGSLGRLALITPALCEKYLQAWAADRQRWHRYLHLQKPTAGRIQKFPDSRRREHALAALSRPGSPPLKWCATRKDYPEASPKMTSAKLRSSSR